MNRHYLLIDIDGVEKVVPIFVLLVMSSAEQLTKKTFEQLKALVMENKLLLKDCIREGKELLDMVGKDGKATPELVGETLDLVRLQTSLMKKFSELYALNMIEESKKATPNPYMKDVKTTDMFKDMDNLIKQKKDGLGFTDEDLFPIIIRALAEVNDRKEIYHFKKGTPPKTPEEIDALLFPSKQIKGVRGSLPWGIDSWDELNIVIYEINFKEIRFLKIVGGRPTDDSAEKIPVKYLRLGDKTMQILSYFGYNPKVTLTNRNAVSRINRYLKAFFKMEENPIVSKDGKYTAEFQVQTYDLNGQPVINKNIHSHGGKFVDEQQIRADEITDIINDEDEENIYRERDDDGEELNFNH
tara:strand:+ start:29 stop:1096 length:1068 start_codon:yes stop_codon:yes gene_type:complete